MSVIELFLYACLYLLVGFAVTWFAHERIIKDRSESEYSQLPKETQISGVIILTLIWPVIIWALVAGFVDLIRMRTNSRKKQRL